MALHEDPVARLSRKVGRTWASIDACAAGSENELARIAATVNASKEVPSDCALVVFGSLARGEFCEPTDGAGSDVDWALLVDGAADPAHLDVAQKIAKRLEEDNYKPPGPTAVFGGPAFSHELVHWIGGDTDSNRNLTRRLLLLLESKSISPSDEVRQRVLRCLLNRYVHEDKGYHAAHEVKVPRFLLNDIVRFWRTMTVDYAAKRRERGAAGWAIRNVKLRLSRKLIFVAGFLMCIRCELRSPPSGKSLDAERDFHAKLIEELLLPQTTLTPLQMLADFSLEFGVEGVVAEAFDHYNLFLAILRDSGKREELGKMDLEAALESDVFQEARLIGTKFQDCLTRFFFNSDPDLTRAAQRYGVF